MAVTAAGALPSERLEHPCVMGLLGRNREVEEEVVLTRARVLPVGERGVPQLHLTLRSSATGRLRETRLGNVAWIARGDGPRQAPLDYLLGAAPVLLALTRDDFVAVARARPVRVPADDLDWGEDGHLRGWLFGLRQCMAPALDAEPLPGGGWETFKVPCYAFAAGDTLYAPAGVQELAWGEALARMRGFAQVLEAEPDERDDEGGALVPGSVTFRTGPRPDEPARCMRLRVTQAEFRRFLKEGRLPPGAERLPD